MRLSGARAPRAWLFALAFLLMVVCVLKNLSENPLSAPFNQIDEQGHFSYAFHLIDRSAWWPDFSAFTMVEVATHRTLTALNYINHPPTFYWLARVMDMAMHPLPPEYLRYSAFALYMLGLVIFFHFGWRNTQHIHGAALYALFPFMLYMQLQVGFYNNDALAVPGGMIAVLGAHRWFAGNTPRRALLLMLAGLALASVKLTSFLLVGLFVLCALLMRRAQWRSIGRTQWFLSALALLTLCIPYLYFANLYGSPAPTTPGQLHMLRELHPPYRGERLELDFMQWLVTFFGNFADQLSVREVTFVPILAYLAASAALVWKLAKRRVILAQPMVAFGLAALIATLTTLAIHAVFSWQRYQAHQWLHDSLIRYYLPLMGAYALISAQALGQLIRKET